MRRKRPPESILEIAVAVGGYRKGFRVVTYIAQWTIAQRALGHEPSVKEAARWWKESERSWFHHQTEFREIFDLLDTPAPIAALVIAEADSRLERTDTPAVIAHLGRIRAPTLA